MSDATERFNGMFLCIVLLVVIGCSGVIHIDNTEMPKTAAELREFIAAKQACIDGLEVELENAKKSRDTLAESDATATGYFAKSETSRRLRDANRDIEFVALRLTFAKSSLAKAMARLDELDKARE
jgi:hypothetical protein